MLLAITLSNESKELVTYSKNILQKLKQNKDIFQTNNNLSKIIMVLTKINTKGLPQAEGK